jgi:hypothetical protein
MAIKFLDLRACILRPYSERVIPVVPFLHQVCRRRYLLYLFLTRDTSDSLKITGNGTN